MRIVVAMSGGVDSSVAAALLHEAGHEVVGLSMQLYDQRGSEERFGSCCTLDDLYDARKVASLLGVPHYVVNLERQFEQQVVSDFVREYAAGRTPLPCAHCNSDLKFATLVERALGLGAQAVATGHYARVDQDPISRRHLLKRGVDKAKDQTYFLFGLTQRQLGRARFPLGGLHKDEVRDCARRFGLPVAEKRDSQEICFVAANDYTRFVADRLGDSGQPGLVVDQDERVVGRHDGIHRFTVGQRKGLGVSSAVPLYVTDIRPSTHTIVVGPRDRLERTRLVASGVNWMAGEPPSGRVRAAVQVRSRHAAAPAEVRAIDGDRVEVRFDAPQLAIAPGQAAVFYEDEVVLGGGWIE